MSVFLLTVSTVQGNPGFFLSYFLNFFQVLPLVQFQTQLHIFRYLLQQCSTSGTKICVSFLLLL